VLRDLLMLAGFGVVTAAVAIVVASLFVRGGLSLRNSLIGIRARVSAANREMSMSFSDSLLDSLKRPVLVLGLFCIFWGFWNFFRAFGFDLHQVAFASVAVVMAAAGGLVAILLMHSVVKLLDAIVKLAEAVWEVLPRLAVLLGCVAGIWVTAYFLRRVSPPLFTWPTGISIALLSGLAFVAVATLSAGLADRRAQKSRWRASVPAIAAAMRAGDWDRAIEMAREAGPATPGALMAHTLEAFRIYVKEGDLDRAITAARQAAKWSSGEVSRHAKESLAMLRTIGSVAPIVALFGTVWAIVRAFDIISTTPSPSPQLIAGTIETAFLVTAICWINATVSILIHRFFAADVRQLQEELDTVQAELLHSLSKSRRASR
jgi:biopolymer transport protein ExbB/TolQ